MTIPDCMRVGEIRTVTLGDKHPGILAELVLCGWPLSKAEVLNKLQPYCSTKDKIAFTDGIAMKGKRIIPSVSLQNKEL